MTTYYVRTTGSDAAAGTSPATAWLTVAKAVSASTAAGDTIWVGGGVYRITTALAPTTRTSMTYLRADTSGYNTGDAGEVVLTGHGTNETTIPGVNSIITLSSKNFWTFSGFTIVGARATVVALSGTTHDITFQDCAIFARLLNRAWLHNGMTFGTVCNVTIERCRIFAAGIMAVVVAVPASASGADTDVNYVIRNCLIMCPAYPCIEVDGTSNTFKSGGITILNCFLFGLRAVYVANVNGIATTLPVRVYNSYMVGSETLRSATAGLLVEDYNYLDGETIYTNVTQGANSKIDGSYDARFSMGQEYVFGAAPRPFGMWPKGSPFLTYGSVSSPAVTDDLLGGPRPGSGTGVVKAMGPYERGNAWVKETGTVHAGSNAISITGPGYQDFALPVDAQATTVTVYMRFDATYAGTLPSLRVVNGGECGVADGSTLMTVGSGTWEAVALNFTPTSKGIVTIRLLSSDTNGAGHVYADDVSVA